MVSRHFVATPDPLWKSVLGASNARVYASETISCFVATNTPNPLFLSKTHVSGGSMPFRSRTWHVSKTGIEAHLMHEFMPLEPFLVFLQQTWPIHYFSYKTLVLDGSAPFRCRTWPILKFSIGCIKCMSLCLWNHFLFCRNEYAKSTISCFFKQTCPIHYFRSKTHVLDGFVPFCCRTWPAAKISIGVHLKHEFVPRKPFLVWSQRTCSIHNLRSKTHVYNSSWYLNALLHSFWRQ